MPSAALVTDVDSRSQRFASFDKRPVRHRSRMRPRRPRRSRLEQDEASAHVPFDKSMDRRDRSPVHLLAAGRRDEIDARSPQRELACRRARLLTDEPGHAQDDEEEKDRGREDQHELVGIAPGLPGANSGRDQTGAREKRRAERGEARCDPRARAPRACASRGAAPRRPRAGSRRSSRRRSSAGGCRHP